MRGTIKQMLQLKIPTFTSHNKLIEKKRHAGYKKAKLLDARVCKMQKGKIGSGKFQPLRHIPAAVPAAETGIRTYSGITIQINS